MLPQWNTLFKWLARYFRAYGGICGVVASPFFGVSVMVAALSYSSWQGPDWPGKVEALIPSLLGFSLGTYAILFSIVSSRLKGALRQTFARPGVNNLEALNAAFFHFIFVQVVTLIWATLYQATWLVDLINCFKVNRPWLSTAHVWAGQVGAFVGFLLLIYSISLMVAAAIAVYRLAMIKDEEEEEEEKAKATKKCALSFGMVWFGPMRSILRVPLAFDSQQHHLLHQSPCLCFIPILSIWLVLGMFCPLITFRSPFCPSIALTTSYREHFVHCSPVVC